MSRLPSLLLLGALMSLAVPGRAQSPGAPQGPSRPVAPALESVPTAAFRATYYEVRASLDVVGQVMNALAKVDFVARDAARVVDVELNQNLRVNSIRDLSGMPVTYERDDTAGMKLHITLAETVPMGGKVTLFFDYGGPLSSRLNNLDEAKRMASIAKDGGYLLLPSRWFPLTDFPANRYTGIFQIEVPGTMTVVGTGTLAGPPQSVTPQVASAAPPPMLGNARQSAPVVPRSSPPAPSMENERMLFTYRVDKPEPAGTFVIAPLQLSPERSQGAAYSIYTPPSLANTAPAYADAVAHVLDYYNDAFGALPNPGMTVAQLPDGTVDGFAAPGLLLVSARQWSAKPNERLLANLVAHQWWGAQVTPATTSDVWVTDGLSRYSEGLYVEQSTGKDGLNKALEDFAVGALMFEDSAPIADAGRLDRGTEEYQSVVVNKGAMVFHMLRAIIGDANFNALLKDFYSRYAGKAARIQDFEQLAESHQAQPAPAEFKLGNAAATAPTEAPSLRPFFTQWLHSTGIPEFTLEYVVYRTKSGFRIVGKAKQNLDVFHMNVEVEVQTEGNPEFKTISISGKESPFTVETFGRPKPNGIILDPHDYILKSSQPLRVRGIIARGESFASEGRYYDAVQQYQKALELDRANALADFRMGEAFFYQRNYAASAQSFRDALDGATDLTTKWTEVWAHIYLGRIYDIQGDRTRAVNEYSKAKQTGDDTGGAQAEAEKSMKKPYSETGS